MIVKDRFPNENRRPVKTLIVMGSGGHTQEMVTIVKKLDKTKYSPRCYIIAHNDKTSLAKVETLEQDTKDGTYSVIYLFRSRNVAQNFLSSIWSTLYAILCSIPLYFKQKPDVILCNGPSTCVPICLVAFALKLFNYNMHNKIVFVESFCRVKTISLSGKILLYLSSLFVVQWPQLISISNRISYYGKLF